MFLLRNLKTFVINAVCEEKQGLLNLSTSCEILKGAVSEVAKEKPLQTSNVVPSKNPLVGTILFFLSKISLSVATLESLTGS